MPGFDYDAVIIGSGPAGLTAGLHLGRAGRRVLVLERGTYGGSLEDVDVLEDYPGLPAGVSGAQLAAAMAEQAVAAGVELDQGEVTGLELFSRGRWVVRDDGRSQSAGVVIVAAGTRFRKLGVPGEDRLRGRGVIDCTPCDAGLFRGRAVAVYGSDDHALADALYLATLVAEVTVLTPTASVTAGRPLRDRATANARIAIRCGVHVDEILGNERVEGLTLSDVATGAAETLPVDGVVVRVGSEPNSDGVGDELDLDGDGRIVVNGALETSAPFVLAAGDVRSGSRPRIAAAVGDGAAAAMRAEELLSASA
jgi:thioredoxin reductase (NADPH)